MIHHPNYFISDIGMIVSWVLCSWGYTATNVRMNSELLMTRKGKERRHSWPNLRYSPGI
jgi:hypothetical protein